MTEQPITLWLTDRSRLYTGLGRCPRERYLKNHFGPTGYGIVRKAESLPLATGKYTHLAFEGIVQYLQQHDRYPSVEIIRASIAGACAEYRKAIEERGYAGLLKSERSDLVVTEQIALLTGLVWAACRTILPWLHREFRVLQCELESIYVLDCTCGLTSANLDAHAHSERGCLGVAQMLKQDIILEHRSRGVLAYMEIKTTGWAADSWAPQWETRPQLAIGTFGIPERYGKDVSETYILGLYKGRRAKIVDASGEWYRQESPCCLGYCRPGNPPLATDDWLPAFEWTDDTTGEVKKAGRAWQKRGIWELEGSDWPTWLASKAADPSLTPSEFWAAYLPQSVVAKQVFLVGPMRVHEGQVADLKQQIPAEEHRWQEILWKLYEVGQEYAWDSPEFQNVLNRLVPQSFECRRYGLNAQCEFTNLCFKTDEQWRDPLAGGKFVPRRPHHQPEMLVAISRGLLPEVAQADEETDE
jgi:hypothetical protein